MFITNDFLPVFEMLNDSVIFTVLDLIYWRDVRRSGIVFASLLLLLISFAMYSALMVFAYVSLAVLAVTISFRIYRQVLASVQKTGDAHPFKLVANANVRLL